MKNSDQADRWLPAEWEDGYASLFSGGEYEATMQILADDRIGILAEISTTLAEMKVQIIQLETRPRPNDTALLNITISCKNVSHYNSIVARLRNITHVISVERGFSRA